MLAPKPIDIPAKPGSYQFYSADNEVLYVGKAKNLRSRVSSYFQAGPKHNIRIDQMLEIADRVEWIVVSNETESLLLEYSLIQQHKPRYNVRLKDDKSYPWLAVTVNEKWPKAGVLRGKQKRGIKYFGPYTSAYAIRETLDVLTTIFPIRTCSPSKFADYKRRGRGCLLADLGKCCAPCIDAVSKDTYDEYVESFIKFLGGDTANVANELISQMEQASSQMHFERAGTLRDRLTSLESIIDRQEIYGSPRDNFDVVSYATDNIEICVEVFRIRKGRLLGSRRFILEPQEIGESETLADQVLLRLYENQQPDVIPPVVYIQDLPVDIKSYEKLLSSQRSEPVRLHLPLKGSKKKLLLLAQENAKESLERRSRSRINDVEQRTKALGDLHSYLELRRIPLRIECFDISHIQGTNTVASMVVIDDGLPKKSEYRHFTITHGQGNDDFLSMEEAISRRFSAFQGPTLAVENQGRTLKSDNKSKFSILPDLLLIDGGKGQLSAVMRALETLGLEDRFDVASLAKREEEVFRPGRSEPYVIPKGSLSLMLLQVARDEAHRFAITHHRKKRSSAMTVSILDEVEGLGPSRKKKLLLSFGSVKALREQTYETLQSLAYLPDNVARNLYEQLHQESVEKK